MTTQTTRTSTPGRSRWILGALLVAAAGVVTAAVVTRTDTREGTIPTGARIVATLGKTISTEHSPAGTHFSMTTVQAIELDDGHAIPAGARISGEVTHSEGGGRIAGAPELSLRFTEISIDGRGYPLRADPFRVKGKSDAVESAAEIGGGAVVGGVVGAIAGKTIEGAVIGAVLGTGVAIVTKGNQIVLPAGQRLRVTVAEPLRVSYREADAKERTS